MKKLVTRIALGISFLSLCPLQATALLPLYKRAVQEPNQSHSFKKRLHNYWNREYNTLIDGGQPLSYECTQLLRTMIQPVGANAYQYANWLRTIRDPLRIALAQFDSEQEREILFRLVHFKMVEGLIQYVRTSLLENLSVIDKAIVYWEKQKSRPFYYFFHKSPLKWFDGKLQDKKIDEHLEALRYHYVDYAKKLGMLSTLCDQFDEPESASDQTSRWLKEMLTFLHSISIGNGKQYELPENNEHIVDALKSITHQLGGYKERLHTLINHHSIPSHIERSWLDYTVIGAGTAVLAFFVVKNKTKIPGWYQSFKQRLVDMFMSPYKEVKSYFFDTSRIQEDDRIKAEFKAKLVDLNEKKMFKDDKGSPLTLSKEQIDDYVNRFDPTILESTADQGIKDVINLSKTAFKKARETKDKSVRTVPPEEDASMFDLWAPQWLKKWNGTAEYWTAITDEVDKTIVSSALSNTDVARIYIRVLVRSLIKKFELAITLGTTVPAITAVSGLSWLATKLYNALWPPTDYSPIRNTLIELEHLLNSCDKTDSHAMEPADYGKMLYLIEKLKQEERLVPSIDKAHFCHDIERLESVMLTSEKKCRIIDLMFRQYSFLR